jgi:hypothetical protein
LKKTRIVFWAFIGMIMLVPILTSAESIVNNNGIEISEEDYNNFLLIHTHEYIMTMDETKYEKLLSLDYSQIEKVTKYVATTYNPSLNLVTEIELTEEQYNNFTPSGNVAYFGGGDQINLNNNFAYYETTAKQLNMVLLGGSVYNYVTLTATWKYIPVTRSFDVIGFRGFGFDFRNGSQHGDQIYILNGTYNDIQYAWNGTNIQKFSNGFGISMNIVNSDIDALQLIVECDVEPTINHPELHGSYQHAINNVTLAQSQNYTLGGGLGGVFVYPYNISQKYDGMSGLTLTF